MGLLLALGWWVGNRRAASTDSEMREHLLRRTLTIAGNVSPDLARKLTFTAADQATPAFEQICTQMIAAGRTFPQRGIYSMALREEQIFFGPENYPTNDPMACPPGTAYQQPPAAYLQVFKDQRPVTVGPVTDEFGTFVSALVPVLDPHSGAVLMVVGVDILATDWQANLNAVGRKPLLVTLLLMLVFLGVAVAIQRHSRRQKPDTLKLAVRICAPVALAMLGGFILYGTYEYWSFEEQSRWSMLRTSEQIWGQWNRSMASKVQLLKAHSDEIAQNPAMRKA